MPTGAEIEHAWSAIRVGVVKRILASFLTWVLLIPLVSAVDPVGLAAATCGVEPPWRFSTTGLDGSTPITSAFVGTVLRRADGRSEDVVVRVERRLTGSAPRRGEMVVDGRPMCGPVRLATGRRYLFAVSATRSGVAEVVMPFETRGRVWDYAFLPKRVGGYATLDGARAPTDPDALVRFLRRRIESARGRLRAAVDGAHLVGIRVPAPLRDPRHGNWAQVVPVPAGGTDLLVGRLDGTGWRALHSPGQLRISGPAAGLVLAQHVDGDQTLVDLVDVRGGTVRRLAETTGSIEQATMHPSGSAWLWLEQVEDGVVLWGESLAPAARPHRLSGVIVSADARIIVSTDGRTVAVDAPDDGAPAWVMDLVDATFRQVDLPDGGVLLPVTDGRTLGVLSTGTDGSVGFPLLRIDSLTGRSQVVAELGSTSVRVTEAVDPPAYAWSEMVDGEAWLHLAATWLPDDRSLLLPHGAGGLVADGDDQGIESPGWHPVFPGGVALDAEGSGLRLAVSHDTGRIVKLPPIAIAASPPALSPRPSTTSLDVLTVPPASEVSIRSRQEARGRPDARVVRHGVRLEVWQSSPTVEPGQWMRFVVRTTNLGRDTAWQTSDDCLTSGPALAAGLRSTIPQGRAAVRECRASGPPGSSVRSSSMSRTPWGRPNRPRSPMSTAWGKSGPGHPRSHPAYPWTGDVLDVILPSPWTQASLDRGSPPPVLSVGP